MWSAGLLVVNWLLEARIWPIESQSEAEDQGTTVVQTVGRWKDPKEVSEV